MWHCDLILNIKLIINLDVSLSPILVGRITEDKNLGTGGRPNDECDMATGGLWGGALPVCRPGRGRATGALTIARPKKNLVYLLFKLNEDYLKTISKN